MLIEKTEPAVNVGSGALVVHGGVGIGKNIIVGHTVRISNETDEQLSSSTGALVVSGGVAITGGLYLGGSSISTVEGSLQLSGELVVNRTIHILNDTDEPVSTSSGAVVIDGGAVIRDKLYINNTDDASSTTTGSLVIGGGIGIGGNMMIDRNITILDVTTAESTSSSTGALVVYGGATINGNLRLNGDILDVKKYAISAGNWKINDTNGSPIAMSGGVCNSVLIGNTTTSAVTITIDKIPIDPNGNDLLGKLYLDISSTIYADIIPSTEITHPVIITYSSPTSNVTGYCNIIPTSKLIEIYADLNKSDFNIPSVTTYLPTIQSFSISYVKTS